MRDKILFYAMPVLKILLFVGLVFLSFLPVAIFSQFNFIQEIKNPLLLDAIGEFGLCLAVISALLMVFQILKNYDFEIVFVTKEGAISGFLKGTLIGFVLILICAGLAMLTNNVVFSIGNINPLVFTGYLFFYILVAVFEEFFFRTFPLLVFAERYHVTVAIFLSSALFGLAHIGNDGFTWLAMLNITLAGALFSIFTLQKWNISWAIGIHFGWNFTQGTVLGYQVSGTKSPGIFSAKPVGASYLSGGSFGIESSVFCTLIMVVLIAYLLVKHKITPVKEVLQEEVLLEETTI